MIDFVSDFFAVVPPEGQPKGLKTLHFRAISGNNRPLSRQWVMDVV